MAWHGILPMKICGQMLLKGHLLVQKCHCFSRKGGGQFVTICLGRVGVKANLDNVTKYEVLFWSCLLEISPIFLSRGQLLRDRDNHWVRNFHHGKLHPSCGGLLGPGPADLAGVWAPGAGGGPLLGRAVHCVPKTGRDLHLYQGRAWGRPVVCLHHHQVWQFLLCTKNDFLLWTDLIF